jgi:hypothetical protein
MNLTDYEQAILFSAMVSPMVWVWPDGTYTVYVHKNVTQIAIAYFYPLFPAMIDAGVLEKVERFPTDGYYPGDVCRSAAFDLWKKAGREPYYPEPGIVAAK